MSKTFRSLRRVWRWLEGDMVVRNDDLPRCLFAQMEGPTPPSGFESNGNSFSPDRFLGNDLRPAGHFHDWSYGFIVRNEEERKEADYAFYRNLRRCGLNWFFARKYFYRVRVWGAFACSYCGFEGQRPRGWAWWKLFISRYVEW